MLRGIKLMQYFLRTSLLFSSCQVNLLLMPNSISRCELKPCFWHFAKLLVHHKSTATHLSFCAKLFYIFQPANRFRQIGTVVISLFQELPIPRFHIPLQTIQSLCFWEITFVWKPEPLYLIIVSYISYPCIRL